MDRGVFDALPDIKDVIDDVPAIVTPPQNVKCQILSFLLYTLWLYV